MRRSCVRSLGACVVVWLLLVGALAQASAEDRALIIGIAKYPQLPERKQLTASVNDARLMERVAREVWGFTRGQIKLLLEEQATSAAIRGEIERWLIAGTKPGDRVFIHYSGHGYYKPTGNPREPDGIDETLAPYDIVPRGGSYDNMILDDEIDAFLQRLEGRDVVLIVDACHSGTITRSLDPAAREGPSIVRSLDHGRVTRGIDGDAEARIISEVEYGRLRRRKVLINPHAHVRAFSSVASTELAHEDMSMGEAERLGVFTRNFVEGLLSGKAASPVTGAVTAAALVGYARSGATAYCQTYSCRTGMTPTIEAPTAMLSRDLRAWRPRSEPGPTGQPLPVQTPAPVKPTDVLPSPPAKGLSVEIMPGANVPLNKPIKLRVLSERPGWLVVLDTRDSGEVVQLFPSICARKSRQLRAGAVVILPDATYGCEFKATPPGRGRIIAIVTEDNIPVEALLDRHRDLSIVPEPGAYLSEIAQTLLKVWTGEARNRSAHWAMAIAPYHVRDR